MGTCQSVELLVIWGIYVKLLEELPKCFLEYLYNFKNPLIMDGGFNFTTSLPKYIIVLMPVILYYTVLIDIAFYQVLNWGSVSPPPLLFFSIILLF